MLISAIAIAVLHAAHPAETPALPKATTYTLNPYRRADAVVGDEQWEISPALSGAGLAIRVRDGEETREVDPGFAEVLGRVVGVAAVGQHYDKLSMIGIACVCATGDENKLEYRVLFAMTGRDFDWKWKCSPVVAQRPIDDPFDVMSIALPEGDTLFVTLQRFSRERIVTVYVRDYRPAFAPKRPAGLQINHSSVDMADYAAWPSLKKLALNEANGTDTDQPPSG